MNYFETLNNINVNDKTETKNGLTYLSWTYAWGELKKKYPMSFYTIYENKEQMNYFNDGMTAWVKTGVTVVFEDGTSLEHIEYLPIMDHRNKSIPLANITSFEVNKSIQRSLTKAVARHGLGLYVYAGEDLPEEEEMKLNESLIQKCKDLNINLENYAKYIKKPVEKLTNEDLKKAISMKEANLKKDDSNA